MGCHSTLQGVFPTQGLNLSLLHYRQILHHLSHQGSPFRIYPVFLHCSYSCECIRDKYIQFNSIQFSISVMSDSETPWTAACQASLSITNSRSLLKLMSIQSVMPSNHLILWCPLLLPSVFPRWSLFHWVRSVLCIRWPKYWSFSISSSNEHSGLNILGLTIFFSLLSEGLSRVFPNTTVQNHQFFGAQLSLWSNCHIHTWLVEKP